MVGSGGDIDRSFDLEFDAGSGYDERDRTPKTRRNFTHAKKMEVWLATAVPTTKNKQPRNMELRPNNLFVGYIYMHANGSHPNRRVARFEGLQSLTWLYCVRFCKRNGFSYRVQLSTGDSQGETDEQKSARGKCHGSQVHS